MAGVEEAMDVGKDGEDRSSKSQFLALVDSRSIDTCQSQSRLLENPKSIDSSQSLKVEFSSHPPKKAAVDIPTDADGTGENPDAYRLWQSKKMEGEVISGNEWQARWSRSRQRR